MNNLVSQLSVLLADTYTLYLKTQNYHWHVRGANFKTLHELFEGQYQELALAVDSIAERIRMLGANAPASFAEFSTLTSLKEGNPTLNSNAMVSELHDDHRLVIDTLTAMILQAQQAADEGTVALLSERISHHEKFCWMLGVSREIR